MKYLMLALCLILSLRAQSQEREDMVAGSFDTTAAVFASSGEAELSLIYDPAELPVEDIAEPVATAADVLLQLKAALLNQQEVASQGQRLIPVAPSSERLLKNIENFSAEDLHQFIAKKQKFLEKVSAWLRWLHAPASLHNKMLNTFNDQFYGSARVIARANAQGGSVRVLAATGLGLNSLLAEKFRATRFGKWFPASGGFFLMLGVGVSVTRLDMDGQKKWVLEVFADYSRLRAVKTFLATASVGLNVNYVSEFQRPESPWLRDYQGSNKGPLGMVITGDGHFSYGPSLVAGFPPFLGATMFYEIQQKRFTLLRLGAAAPALANSCERVFAF